MTPKQQPLDSTPAHHFQNLLNLWSQDHMDERCDVLAAELASEVARHGATTVGLYRSDAWRRMLNVYLFLHGYGIELVTRYRQQGDGMYIVLEPERPSVPFEGAVRPLRFQLPEALS
jgi:hypothetical protein